MFVVVRILFALLVLVGVAEAQASSQQVASAEVAKGSSETNRTILPFLDGTDVFWTLQSPKEGGEGEDKHFVRHKLEANINPNLVFFQNFTATVDLDEMARDLARTGKFRDRTYAISATPGVRLRMLFEPSSPVRTPSFTPRVNVQAFWNRSVNDCKPGSTRMQCLGNAPLVAITRQPHFSLYEGHVTFGHYSNGQDGCLSLLQTRVDGECEGPDALTPDTINTVNGSFSIRWFVRAGFNYSRNLMKPGELPLEASKEIRVHGDLEYGAHDDQMNPYGNWRFTAGLSGAIREVRFCRKRLEGALSGGYYHGTADTVTPWSATGQVSCFPTTNGGWGIFARIHKGQDYYNVQFFENTTRFQVGITYNQTGFFRFVKRPHEGSTMVAPAVKPPNG